MRLVGYCTGCRTVKYVRVGASQLALGVAIGGVCEGICSTCEDREACPSCRRLPAGPLGSDGHYTACERTTR